MLHDLIVLLKDWEWLLLGGVAILEVAILVVSRREDRERRHLVAEMRNTRVELGRESYVAMKKQALGKARDYVYSISHTLNSDMSSDEEAKLFRLYRKVGDHRIITANDPGKIRAMWDQHQHGAQVRVNPMVMISTFRFQVSDDRDAVLGFSSEGEEMSVKGTRISNPYFCRMLKQHFEAMWEDSIPWEEYVRSFVSDVRGPETNCAVESLTEELQLTDEDKEEFRKTLAA